MDFTTRKVIVIGGTSGIGLAVARRVLAGGGSAVVTGRTRSSTDRAVAELVLYGKTDGLAADLTDFEAVDLLRADPTEWHADATLLVNAAGVFAPKLFLDHTPADFDRYQILNRALFLITQTVVQNVIDREERGSVVNIGSMWARQAVAATPSSAYSMAKAGLHAPTQHLALELAPYGIRVNAVAPAFVRPRSTRSSSRGEGRRGPRPVRRLPPARPHRHPGRRRRHRRLPALRPGRLGDRRRLGRRRRRHGRARLTRVATPVPSRSSRKTERPVMAMIKARVGPVTSSPAPVAKSPSVASSRRPPMRPLAGTFMSLPA